MRILTIMMSILFLSFFTTQAQITITANNIEQIYQPGNVYVVSSDTLQRTVDIGSLGSTSWDFTALQEHYTESSEGVDPSTTPYASDYPNATHAQHYTIGSPVSVEGWNYVSVTNGLLQHGYASESGGIVNSMTKSTIDPDKRIFDLPLTMNTSWTTDVDKTIITYLNGSPVTTTDISEHTEYTVDAYGMLTLPGGDQVNAVRIKEDTRSYSVLFGTGSYSRQISYNFMAKDGSFVKVFVPDTTAPETGLVTISNASFSNNGVTGVEDNDNVVKDYLLEPNYPNPFNPSTNITFRMPEAGEVELKVYDALGNEVAVLIDEYRAAGTHTATFHAGNLASGLYIARINAGGFTESIKMTLMK